MPFNPDDHKVSRREELVANLRGLVLVFRASPALSLSMLVSTAIQGSIPAVIIAQTAKFLGRMPLAIKLGASSTPGLEARTALIWLGSAIMLSQVIGPVHQAIMFGLQRRFQAYLALRLMTGVSALPGLAYFEDSEFRDKLEITQWIGWAPVQSVQTLSGMYNQFAQMVSMAFLAATFRGWVPALIVLAAIPEGIAAWKFESTVGWLRLFNSKHIRKSNYFKDLALKVESAKEMRIFGLKDWTLTRQVDNWMEGMVEVWKKRQRGLFIALALHIASIGSISFVYISLLNSTIKGVSSGNPAALETFLSASMGATGMLTAVLAVFSSARMIRQNNFFLPTVLKLLDIARDEPRMDITGTKSAHGLTPKGIRFEDVSFTYPGSERKILDGLDLFIPPASSVALVGENGAGKTTLIKLLCRFYDPTEGRITLDGVDIREFDLEDLRTRLAVIFQDFVHYKLPAKDNIGFGAVEHFDDLSLISEAATRVGVLTTLQELDNGLDTPLAREFDGTDLSGGQWQRVALARAIMAQIGKDADLLILDEPTASLDVRLEHELYEHFAELSSGRTTLLVSHRFSTVRMAERIIFMEEGKVVEDGPHDLLMSQGGRYADLYDLQASHYRETGVLE